jgi:hypothetical protein
MNTAIQLDAAATARIIEASVRTQSQVVLEMPRLGLGTINGFLISADDRALLMEITGRLAIRPADLVQQACDVNLYADQRYLFSSSVTAAPQWGESRSLALARPSVLRVLERRRFLRAKLAPSSKVSVEWMCGGTTVRHVAPLLNISLDGLACRMDERAAATLQSDDVLTVSFDLPGQDNQFRFTATVCTKTAASGGYVILGLQFVQCAQSADAIAELRTALGEPLQPQPKSPIFV